MMGLVYDVVVMTFDCVITPATVGTAGAVLEATTDLVAELKQEIDIQIKSQRNIILYQLFSFTLMKLLIRMKARLMITKQNLVLILR